MNVPKIGDRVDATTNGEDWFRGVYKEDCDILAPYGVLTDIYKEIRYFISIRPVCEECEKKDKLIEELRKIIEDAQEEIDGLNCTIDNQWQIDAGEDL